MDILNALFSLMFAIFAGLVLVFCITIMACILLFSTRITITMGKAKMVTTFEQATPNEEFARPIIASEPTHLTIEFDEAELLAKLAKEMAPHYGMTIQIAVKNQTWAIISLNIQPSDSTWNADLHLKKDTQEVKDTEEERLVFSCKRLRENCTLAHYEAKKEPIIQSLELSDVIRALLQALHHPYHNSPQKEATDTHENVRSEEAEIYQTTEE